MQQPRRKIGFTLIELLVVVSIIAVLVGLLLPALNTVRESARRSLCSGRHKQLSLAISTYYEQHRTYPPAAYYPFDSTATTTEETYVGSNVVFTSDLPAFDQSTMHDPGIPTGMYSFVVKILPYIEHAHLYNRMDLSDAPYGGTVNPTIVDDVLPLLQCPSFSGASTSSAAAASGLGATLTQYKCIGATHETALNNSQDSMSSWGNGGALHPYGTVRAIPATSQTILLTETREEALAGWADGTTAALYGLTGSPNILSTRAVVNNQHTVNATDPDPENGTFDVSWGTGEMKWGPSSQHPGITNHSFVDTTVRSVNDDIDAAVYGALITRRDRDNGDIGDFFSK